jgi:hypothetical protein
MSSHDDLLKQGPRQAPEPETAEEKSRKLGLKTAGGAVVGGGAVVAKAGLLGGLGKFVFWFFAWRGVFDVWRIFGWIGLAVVLGVAAFFLIRRLRADVDHLWESH